MKTLYQLLNEAESYKGICTFGMRMKSPTGEVVDKLKLNGPCHYDMQKTGTYNSEFANHIVTQVSFNINHHIGANLQDFNNNRKKYLDFLNFLITESPMKHYIKKANVSSAMKHGLSMKYLNKHTFTHAALVGVITRDLQEHAWKVDVWTDLVAKGVSKQAAYLACQFKLNPDIKGDQRIIFPHDSHQWLRGAACSVNSYIAFCKGEKYVCKDQPISNKGSTGYKGISCAVHEIVPKNPIKRLYVTINEWAAKGIKEMGVMKKDYITGPCCTYENFVQFWLDNQHLFDV